MVKIDVLTLLDAEEEIAKLPPRTKKGKWTELCAQVVKSKSAAKVSDISRGQAAALSRTAKDKGLETTVQALKGGKAVVWVLPKGK